MSLNCNNALKQMYFAVYDNYTTIILFIFKSNLFINTGFYPDKYLILNRFR